MTAIRLATLALIATVATANAQTQQPFQGIEGEVKPPAPSASSPFRDDAAGFTFDIGRASPTESSLITERAAPRGDFYRSTILSGRRAGASGTTGLTIFDKLFD